MSNKKDICECPDEKDGKQKGFYLRSVGEDPRFQQQNQTLRCFVSYRDFYRCENVLGQGHEACVWFKDVFLEFCPRAWIEKWDEQRAENRFPSNL